MPPEFDLLVADARVLSPDRAGARLERADIPIKDGRIVRLAPPGSLARHAARELIAAGGGLAMPGLVNAHTHSPENLARGRAERARLSEWMGAVWPALDTLPAHLVRLAIEVGAAEMIRHGVTSVVDHFRQTPMTAQALTAAVEAYAAIGMRCTLAVMLRDGADAGALIGAPHVAAAPSAADQISLVAETTPWAQRQGVDLAFGPSAPHRCSDGLLRTIAREHRDLPVHTHVDETVEDAQAAYRRFGRSSVSQLDHIGLLGPRLACAHAVHVSAPDIDRLAATGTVVVHNPVSNMRLGSGIAPLPAFLAAGVAVALGADGAPADLLVFDDDPLAQLDQGSAEANLVFGSPAHRPRHVIARGRVLMRDRSLTTIDEAGLRDRLRAHRRELAA